MKKKHFLSAKTFIIFIMAAIALVLILRVIGTAVSGGAKIESDADIVKFLSSFGWEVNPEPVNVKTVEIPKDFSEVYLRYNELQKSQGYDLAKHKGETAQCYTFEILNFRDKTGVFANVLVAGGKIIGGDICSYALDGFMVGFNGT